MNDLAEPLQQVRRTQVRYRGRKLTYFGGCDYYRLASHPFVLRALAEGVAKYGLNVSASRKTTGNHALYEKLEQELDRFFGAEAALLVSSGYVSNLVVAQGLAGEFSHVLLDERSHGSLADAAPMFGCTILRFPHRQPDKVRPILKKLGRRAKPILLTDGMFSHDGQLAPLERYLELLPRAGWMLVDDAHAAGVLGKKGRGTAEFLGIHSARVIQTTTLSKAFGVYGGAVLATGEVIRKIIERSRIFVGNTPMPLPLANAALKSLEIVRHDREMRRRLAANTQRVKAALARAGFEVADTPSPIVAIAPRSQSETNRLKGRLLKAGIFPSLIRYPGGPAKGYFRFALSSEHTATQLKALEFALSPANSRG
jgi:8-amino-7-oxononanoate synthase